MKIFNLDRVGMCPEKDCQHQIADKGWTGARLVQGIEDIEYLFIYRYECSLHKKTFNACDEIFFNKLPQFVQSIFPFVLKAKTAFTKR
jgi:hypothetical protein